MDIKLECADLLVRALGCVCVRACVVCEREREAGVCICLCVVRKLPTDTSPREVLQQVCVGLAWESRVKMCTFRCARGFGSVRSQWKSSPKAVSN